MPSVGDVTQILDAIDAGDPQAAAQLLPLVYDELRKLASAKLAYEKPGYTLDATGLVHEAYLRLVASVEPVVRSISTYEAAAIAGAVCTAVCAKVKWANTAVALNARNWVGRRIIQRFYECAK